jgi:hypothetical protein
MQIKNLGPQVARVWDDLRPTTKRLLAGALNPGSPLPSQSQSSRYHYDAHADWELSRLLAALDERSKSKIDTSDAPEKSDAVQLAETCARILEEQSGSAEVFIQLAYAIDSRRLITTDLRSLRTFCSSGFHR